MVNPYEPPVFPEPNIARAAAAPNACVTCGRVLAKADLLYDETGNVTCQKCLMAAQVEQGFERLASRLRKIAWGAPALGLVSLVFNPFFAISLGAIGNGLYVLRGLREEENAKRLADSATTMKLAAIAGIVIGGLTLALHALMR